MGRPALGSASRNIVVSTKASVAERDALVAKYGSVYVAMRIGLRMALGFSGHEDSEEVQEATHVPAPVTDHKHRRGEEVDAIYEKGVRRRRFACAHPECPEVLS